MNINKNIRYHRKKADKLRGIPTRLLMSRLIVALSYRTWFSIDTKTHSFYLLVQHFVSGVPKTKCTFNIKKNPV